MKMSLKDKIIFKQIENIKNDISIEFEKFSDTDFESNSQAFQEKEVHSLLRITHHFLVQKSADTDEQSDP